jgi:hypothetical protein
MGTIRSKADITVLVQKLLAGLDEHYAGQTLTINGTAVPVAEIGTRLKGYLTLVSTADATKTLWQQQIRDARAAAPDTTATVVAVHDIVRGNLGASNPALAEFGMKPRTPAKRTSQELLLATQKSLATRVARHTTGPKRKKAIHGAVAASPAVKPKTE